ncbi:MAG TPA: di-heme oxidoredictase family protein [Planctomycetota bacterium]|nr:di-heme oxidoredictase family protein [Planctomycetota bacterium]
MFREAITSVAASLVLTGIASAQAGDVAIQAAMGSPVQGLTASQLDRFQKGALEFDHILIDSEGLGPCFNDSGCVQCHSTPKPGGSSALFVQRFGKAATGSTPFDPLADLGGSLLQASAIDPAVQEVIPPEADVTTHRTTPSAFGAGLVQAISDDVLRNLAQNPPSGFVHGVAHEVTLLEDPQGPTHVGRFGWKAQVATMLSFSGDASLNEMGLTNALVGTENAPNGNQALLQQYDLVPDPEDQPDAEGFTRIERMDDFQRFLAAPPQTPKSGMTGATLFNQIGCADCHVATYTTTAQPEAALSNKVIHPYSDFLLHDMGTLGDNIVQGMGTEKLMRTSSLWGMAARAQFGLLHDGSAVDGTAEENIAKAIAAHDGEGAHSRGAFSPGLSAEDQAKVLAFVMSLGRLEFDAEKDNDVDAIDWFVIHLSGWFQGPGAGSVTPDSPAAVADIDQDGDVDLVDFGLMQRAMTP